jgi:hypothetical protein
LAPLSGPAGFSTCHESPAFFISSYFEPVYTGLVFAK